MSQQNGFKEQLNRRKRINRLKNFVIAFVLGWMVLTVAGFGFLLYRVSELEHEINVLAGQKLEETQPVEEMTQEQYSTQTDVAESTTLILEDQTSNLAEAGDVPKVYLTFDDGPSENTEAILDVLAQYGVKATFFVVGSEKEGTTEILQRIVAEGHTLGMHSYAHKYSEIYSSLDAFEADFIKESEYVTTATGVKPLFYRFPGGSNNQISNTDMGQFISYLNEQNITYFDWNVSGGDATNAAYTSQEIVDNVQRDVVKYKTSVVLLHDADDKDQTVEALGPLIEALLQMNAEILPIDENTTVVHYATVE